MASARDLRRRIRSVKNTSQITKAMQMVSATKMRRAQAQALSGRPYTLALLSVLDLVANGNGVENPLLKENGASKVGVLVISTDKGLCGALNTNIFRVLQSVEVLKNKETVIYTVGKKGRDFSVRTNKGLEADFENTEKVSFPRAVKVRKFLTSSFLNNEVGEIYLLYPHFISTLRQEPRFIKLLPINTQELANSLSPTSDQEAQVSDFFFEPNKEELLDYALTHLIDSQIYQALLELKASEHSARMMAMQSATDNASELVADLTLTYNQLRQESITKELLEITTAGVALET